MRIETPVVALFLLSVAACGASAEGLVTRAAFDLDCPQDSLHVVELDSHVRGVTGCGQRATYVESCNGGHGEGAMAIMTEDCKWVLNSNSRANGGGKSGE
jgi:hypothetical protein